MGKRPLFSLASVLLSLERWGRLEYAAHKRKHSQTLPTASPVSAGSETGGRQGEGNSAAQKAVTETMRLPFYHGKINKGQTEDLLASSGKNGSYLIRDSETVPGSYCLCVLNQTFVHTYRVFENSGTWHVQTSKGILPRFFSSIEELILTYTKPDQGTVVPLLHPVEHNAYKIGSHNEDAPGEHEYLHILDI
ncbi:SH2 domain-containing protein 1A-like isoform X2 [Rhincodon typus]|uniref:SH2 domain-containing protein 1A-like isoform X2 n=1 Tax=Rhincodon typus TaxID=259920 RepID=UPI0009A3662E|nr:SH2 domain-containing protein 1A-like isoform X2 [Rhincodon typus]